MICRNYLTSNAFLIKPILSCLFYKRSNFDESNKILRKLALELEIPNPKLSTGWIDLLNLHSLSVCSTSIKIRAQKRLVIDGLGIK